MAVPQEKPGEKTLEDEEEIIKELCLINGINHNRLIEEGVSTLQLEIFFSGYPRIVGLNHFPNLLSMVIVGQAVSKIEGLTSLPQLRELWIAECKLQKIEGLQELKLIQKLYLYSNEISCIENLDHLTELEVLWLHGNKIKDITGLSNLTGLKDLNLAENLIEKIGSSLNSLSMLESLEISGNRISSFKDLTNLVRLPRLVELGLKSPMYAPSLVGLLCNYQTHILYHLPNLKRLDTYDVTTKQLKDHAEGGRLTRGTKELSKMTVLKKKMYYNMKVKTLRRNLGELLGRLNMAHAHLLAIPYQKLRQLLLTLRGVEKGLKIVEADEMRTPHETPRQTPAEGLESCRDSKDKGSGDQGQHQRALCAKQRALKEYIRKWERKTAEIEHYWAVSCEKVHQLTEGTIQRLMIELETGGNVRFEDGKPSDVWFSSCHDLLLSRFCAADYKDYGIVGIKVHRITRVHNRILHSKFEDSLARLVEDEDLYNPVARAASQKKLLEYLFFVWDPILPGGSTEPIRVLDEGFMDSEIYKKLGRDAAVPLANSLSLADKHRMSYNAKQSKGREFTDSCPFRQGQVIVAKVYIGKSAAHSSSKLVEGSLYPKADTVYRARKDMKESPVPTASAASGDLIGLTGPAPMKTCECRHRQSEWFAFNHELVMPEYVIDFEYLTRVKPKSPFASFTEDIMDNKEKPTMPSLDDAPSVDDVLQLEPEIRPRIKIAHLAEEAILNAAGVTALSNVRVLDLHGCGLTKLRQMQSLPHLRKLVVSFNDLTRLDDICHLNLEHLDASFNKVTSLDGIKGLQKLKYLDVSWNQLFNTRDEITTLRKHAPVLTTLDLRYNRWQKRENIRLRAIGRIKTLTKLNGAPVTEMEATAALRLAAGSRISQVALLTHSRTDLSPPRTLNLDMYAQVLTQCSRNKPDRLSEQDSLWYLKVTTLNLDKQHISKLSNLERLENLRWASFNDNDITKIESLDNCVHLEELSLEQNCLTRLEGLSRLLRLRRLAVGHNYLTSLENAGLDKLPSLTFLSVENNQIPSMSGLQRLAGLVELYIGNNAITNIREVFFLKPLPNLVILDLYGNQVAISVESYRLFVIFHLKTLKALDGLAIELSEATQAKDAFGGRLTSDFVAERLGHANFNGIKELDFPHCSIRTVDIGNGEQFLSLRSVNLEHNNLTSFSGLIFLVNLRVLCLNHNHVDCVVPRPKQIPPSLRRGLSERTGMLGSGVDPLSPDSYTPVLENLEVLHLGYNNIKDMAALQLNRLTSLKALFLQGNEITKVEGLEGLQDLRELVLDRNKVKAISEYSFCNQWNLQELHIEENRLKDLSHLSSLENLHRLFLGMNRIQDMSELERFENMSNLVELSVVGNAVARRLLHRPMLVYRMRHLLVIDGIPVSDEERAKAELYFMEQQREKSNSNNYTKAVGGNISMADSPDSERSGAGWTEPSSPAAPSQPTESPDSGTKPQQMATVETTLPGIGQYKTQMPVKVTNMQLLSGPFVDKTFGGTLHLTEDIYQQDLQRAFVNLPQGAGRRRGGYRDGIPGMPAGLGNPGGGRVGSMPFQQLPGNNSSGGGGGGVYSGGAGVGSRSQHQMSQVPYVPHQGGATDHYSHTESLTRLNKNNRR